MNYINENSLVFDSAEFNKEKPFPHIVIDNFLKEDIAIELYSSFPDYESNVWHVYSNAVENKKTNNNWNDFTALQYQVFSELVSEEVLETLSRSTQIALEPDFGLHGGGIHIHSQGGELNPHLDYSIHPKMSLQRKINIIIYLEQDYQEFYGGHLGLWSANKDGSCKSLEKEVSIKFNRAVIFDTSRYSWHGMSKPLNLPTGKYRKSFATYYLTEPPKEVDPRTRALFHPREEQKNDESVWDLIRDRADESKFSKNYIDND